MYVIVLKPPNKLHRTESAKTIVINTDCNYVPIFVQIVSFEFQIYYVGKDNKITTVCSFLVGFHYIL